MPNNGNYLSFPLEIGFSAVGTLLLSRLHNKELNKDSVQERIQEEYVSQFGGGGQGASSSSAASQRDSKERKTAQGSSSDRQSEQQRKPSAQQLPQAAEQALQVARKHYGKALDKAVQEARNWEMAFTFTFLLLGQVLGRTGQLREARRALHRAMLRVHGASKRTLKVACVPLRVLARPVVFAARGVGALPLLVLRPLRLAGPPRGQAAAAAGGADGAGAAGAESDVPASGSDGDMGMQQLGASISAASARGRYGGVVIISRPAPIPRSNITATSPPRGGMASAQGGALEGAQQEVGAAEQQKQGVQGDGELVSAASSNSSSLGQGLGDLGQQPAGAAGGAGPPAQAAAGAAAGSGGPAAQQPRGAPEGGAGAGPGPAAVAAAAAPAAAGAAAEGGAAGEAAGSEAGDEEESGDEEEDEEGAGGEDGGPPGLIPLGSSGSREADGTAGSTGGTAELDNSSLSDALLGLPSCVGTHVISALDADGVRVLRLVSRALYFEASRVVTKLVITPDNLETLVSMPLHTVMPRLRTLIFRAPPPIGAAGLPPTCQGPQAPMPSVWPSAPLLSPQQRNAAAAASAAAAAAARGPFAPGSLAAAEAWAAGAAAAAGDAPAPADAAAGGGAAAAGAGGAAGGQAGAAGAGAALQQQGQPGQPQGQQGPGQQQPGGGGATSRPSGGFDLVLLMRLATEVLPHLQELECLDLRDAPLHAPAQLWAALLAGVRRASDGRWARAGGVEGGASPVRLVLREHSAWARGAMGLLGNNDSLRDARDHFPPLYDALRAAAAVGPRVHVDLLGVTVRRHTAARLPQLCALQCLTSLTLFGKSAATQPHGHRLAGHLAGLARLSQLTRLELLSYEDVSDTELAPLSACPRLAHLYIDSLFIKQATGPTFPALTSLTAARIKFILRPLTSIFPALTQLRLGVLHSELNKKISSASLSCLAGCSEQLHTLCVCPVLWKGQWQVLPTLPGLTRLVLVHCRDLGHLREVLRVVGSSPSIRELELQAVSSAVPAWPGAAGDGDLAAGAAAPGAGMAAGMGAAGGAAAAAAGGAGGALLVGAHQAVVAAIAAAAVQAGPAGNPQAAAAAVATVTAPAGGLLASAAAAAATAAATVVVEGGGLEEATAAAAIAAVQALEAADDGAGMIAHANLYEGLRGSQTLKSLVLQECSARLVRHLSGTQLLGLQRLALRKMGPQLKLTDLQAAILSIPSLQVLELHGSGDFGPAAAAEIPETLSRPGLQVDWRSACASPSLALTRDCTGEH